MTPRLVAIVALFATAPLPGWPADASEAVVTLQISAPAVPGQVPEAMPPRFVLTEDGTVYVGGTSAVATARIEGPEIKGIEKEIERIRKIPGLATRIDLGAGVERTYRIIVRKGKLLDLTAVGDLAGASAAFRPVVSLITRLADYSTPDLHPYRPTSYALSAREENLPGGCRAWTFPVALPQALTAPQVVSATVAEAWPTGGIAASVCAGEKRYVVALRPMLPGERR
jgi:hypothetical protein